MTSIFVLVRHKRTQLTILHFYLNIDELLIICVYVKVNLNFIHGFMMLSIISSVFKYIYYLLYGFTHVSALYRLLKRFKEALYYMHYVVLSYELIYSLKFVFCDDSFVFLVHLVDIVAVIAMERLKKPKIKI